MIQIPERIAHRGFSAEAPENTMAAFRLAEQKGYQMFECDVQLSSDGVPVIFHDETVERTTTGQGLLQDHSFAELQALGVNSLAEVLEWLTTNTMSMNLELKGQQLDLVDRVSAVLKPYLPKLNERILISSFEWEQLEKFNALNLNLPRGVLVDDSLFHKWGFDGIRARMQSLGALSLNLDAKLLQGGSLPEFLAICPIILVYTVKPHEIFDFIKQGISGVFTNG